MENCAATCTTCPHACRIAPGGTGRCGARANVGGQVVDANYGRVTSLALDPVEKKPLARWRPGSLVLSVGSYGCTMGCANCQNCSIACGRADTVPWRPVSPKELVETALELQARDPRVTGLAFTYNEPLCGWEYVRDAGRLAHRAGLANVLVSNGMANPPIVAELLEVLDAANIDLKAWSDSGYRQLGGDLGCVKETIATLAACPTCHLEVTTLLVPGLVSVGDVAEMARWLAGLDPAIPYHVTRFFPAHRMAHASPTPVKEVYEAAEAARKAGLAHVYTGNC